MFRVLWVIVLSATNLYADSTVLSQCTVLSSGYFQWLNADGTLVLNQTYDGVTIQDRINDTCCGQLCNEKWKPIKDEPSCLFCVNSNVLVCRGMDVARVPDPSTLPSTRFSLYKMSGFRFFSLPPNSFTGLTIQTLVIENSNLTYISPDTFNGVKAVTALHLRNNTINYLVEAGRMFKNLPKLRVLDLENNDLKVLSTLSSANLKKLEYLSLAGNPIYRFNAIFLQNSNISFLDLRGVTLRESFSDMKNDGFLSLPNTLRTLDLSGANMSVEGIGTLMYFFREKNITTVNLGFFKSSYGLLGALLYIKNSLTYLSLQGTDMNYMFEITLSPDMVVSVDDMFVSLKELNMKACNIQHLGSGEIFRVFPNLTILSLSNNQFQTLDLTFFTNLPTMRYVDLSGNILNYIDNATLTGASTSQIQALDLSFVEFDLLEDIYWSFFRVLENLQELSLCGAELNGYLVASMRDIKTLRFLDLSKTLPNDDLIPAYSKLFLTLNSSLIELRFARNGFTTANYPSFFSSLTSLKVLDLSNNLIRDLPKDMFGTSLNLLFLSQNLITTWYSPLLNYSRSNLKYLDLANNQITFISNAMLEDFYKLEFLDLDGNPLICHKKVVAAVCADIMNKTHNLTILGWQQYNCYDIISNTYRLFSKPKDCDEYYEEVSTTQKSNDPPTSNPDSKTTINGNTIHSSNMMKIYLLIGFIMLMCAAGSIVYAKWWNFRCYIHRYFSLRKARLIRKEGEPLAKPEMCYDVFVSYSDVDRSWVLDQLIPNIEGEGDITLCFHERDFQVGVSILENIIECMDRSHSLLLIVSSAFVRSKWCQFEMHLAQYRLIETFRDQLILVLLEDIPRNSRPQTLHHLMMTKTYLIWPQQPGKEDATELFWRRLKRALKPNHNHAFNITTN